MTSQFAIRFTDVSKTYTLYPSVKHMAADQLGLNRLFPWRRPPEYKQFHALRDINFTIRPGERVGIIGRNGAGKTTLLKMVTGNFQPSQGRVEIHGSVHALMNTGTGITAELSGLDNIKAALAYSGLSGASLRQAIDDAVDFVELGKFLTQPMSKYSLGMAARVRFAAATAVHPDILIIDEVMGAGDAYFLAKSAQRMKALTDAGSTLLLVSHSMQQIMQFCDSALWLERGRVLKQAPASEIAIEYERQTTEVSKKEEQASAASSVHSLASSHFLRAAITPEEPVDYVGEHEIVDALDDGREVYRWPGKQSHLRISGLDTKQGNGSIESTTGGDIQVGLRVTSDIAASYRVTYCVSVYNLRGERVTRSMSSIDEFSLQAGEQRSIKCNMSPVLLGAGNYIASIAIFDASRQLSKDNQADLRLDLLSRCLHIRIYTSNDPDPPMLHCMGTWHLDGQLIPSRIDSWV